MLRFFTFLAGVVNAVIVLIKAVMAYREGRPGAA